MDLADLHPCLLHENNLRQAQDCLSILIFSSKLDWHMNRNLKKGCKVAMHCEFFMFKIFYSINKSLIAHIGLVKSIHWYFYMLSHQTYNLNHENNACMSWWYLPHRQTAFLSVLVTISFNGMFGQWHKRAYTFEED